MLTALLLALAGYQGLSFVLGWPRVSKLAHTPPYSFAIWWLLAWLVGHLVWEAHRGTE